MFGRQDSDDTTNELDNEHADYVTDLTSQDDNQAGAAVTQPSQSSQSSPFGGAGITPPPGASPFGASPTSPPSSQTTDDDSPSDAPSPGPADAFEPASAPALPDDDSSSNDTDKTAVSPSSARAESSTTASTPGDNALLDIKRSALSDLSPLVEHLDQSPEEQFRTTMMLIQATDNQELIKEAYAAAQKISDEKIRAQALLDVINEINYFTHQKDGE